MSSSLSTLSPPSVWTWFDRVCAIPRPSGQEQKILEFLRSQADSWGLDWVQDKTGNLVIRKPAFPGYEKRPGVVLQGHVDMVAEKNRGTTHDFSRDPIIPVIDGDWVRARNTTLGADNGIAVAAMLAVLQDKNLPHGPLECLFTVDEEAGLTGAINLEPGLVKGRYLLNLDSEDLGRFTIGCAGGATSRGVLPLAFAPASYPGCQLVVKGLWGGHSGMDINDGRGNALVLAGRVLRELHTLLDGRLELSGFEGGDKHNAIPREALLTLGFAPDFKPKVQKLLQNLQKSVREGWGDYGAQVEITLGEPVEHQRSVGGSDLERLIDFIALVPDGVRSMSRQIPGLVETSCNLAAVKLEAEGLKVVTSQRSSRPDQLAGLQELLSALYRRTGGSVTHGDGYPPWPPKAEGPLLALCRNLWKRLSGREAVVEVVHAGLECGLIGEKCPGMDMISFGPDIRDPHTPQERISIASVAEFWPFLLKLLEELK